MTDSYFSAYLRALDAWPSLDGVLGDEIAIHPPDPDFGYSSTPRNALTFGQMGVDGVHYAVLAIDGEVTDQSPVIEVSPMDFGECYSVLAENFLEFLAVGCGADHREIKELFVCEREGEPALMPFLVKKFNIERVHNYSESGHLKKYLRHIEPKAAE